MLELPLYLRELTFVSMLLRIILAVVIGGMIGLERGYRLQSAGFRTYILVSLGAAIVMMTNHYIFQVYETGDPTRMGAQVVSGIGFLGAGTIMRTDFQQVKGLTTAAGLWASAALGLAIGIGLYELAIIGGVLITLILAMFHPLKKHIERRTNIIHLYIEVDALGAFKDLLLTFTAHHWEIEELKSVGSDEVLVKGNVGYQMKLIVNNEHEADRVLEVLKDYPGVVNYKELIP